MDPRVSIIVPNFDNGRTSSRSGRDLLGELFRSLERTLAGDATSHEIVVADDGSSDDSLETCRAWARRVRPDGRPFLRLIELPHSGVLSRVLNVLERESRGEFLARLDGDIVLRTERWLEPLVAMFDADESLGVATALQLLPDGAVHALGDDLWGPRGYRHVGGGAPADALPAEREVDHAMGCFYMTRRRVHERIGGYDESVLRGQTEEYGVRVRLDGWRVKATTRVRFEHWHVDRLPRANRADRAESLDEALARFRSKWGFDRLAPDLAAVRARYAGTPLWWRDHAALGREADADEWRRVGAEPAEAERLRLEVEQVGRALRAASGPCPVAQIGCGAGVLGTTLARQGIPFEGCELAGAALSTGQAVAAGSAKAMPAAPPRFHAVPDLGAAPWPDRSQPVVVLAGVLERAWNPVGVLLEARRVVAERGVVLVRSRLRDEPLDDPDERGHRFTAHELLTLLRHVGGLEHFGADPRVVRGADGGSWIECTLRAVAVERGRGYFSRPVEQPGAAVTTTPST